MYINHIEIQNFRGFEYEQFTLNPKFTVAIGNNGMGKSSLLQALQVALGAYLQCLPIPASPIYRRQFRSDEKFKKWDAKNLEYIPNKEETLIKTSAVFVGSSLPISWIRKMMANGNTTHNRRDTGSLVDAISNHLQKKEEAYEVLPVVSSFGTERTNAQLRKGKKAQKRRSRMEKGFLAALSNKVDFDGVIEWLHNYDSELKYEREFEGTREAVFEAISIAIPYLQEISYSSYYQELEAIVDIGEKHLGKKTHSNMSDGLKAMLNLVAELAYRCAILNGFLGRDAVKQTSGVVLIDELDMHLHPNWQRHVVSDLKNAFPNIQFIVTTHSPFIVQSLESNELINLDAEPNEVSPKELSIDVVSHEIMGVESNYGVDNQEQEGISKDYLELLKEAEFSSEPKNYIKKLEEMENSISDPGLRALLRMDRISKNII